METGDIAAAIFLGALALSIAGFHAARMRFRNPLDELSGWRRCANGRPRRSPSSSRREPSD